MSAEEGEAGPEVLPVAAPEEAAPVKAAERPGLEIGDKIVILGGTMNKTRGKLYGWGPDRMSILTTGSTDRLTHIPLVESEDDGMIPDPELGIEKIMIVKKAPVPGLVALLDARAGQELEAFGPEGALIGVYKIVAVDSERDALTAEDEAGVQTEIEIGFQEIDRSLGIEVLRTREPPAPAPEGAAQAAAEGAEGAPRVDLEEEDALEEGGLPSREEEDEEARAAAGAGGVDFELGEEIELPADQELVVASSAEKLYPDVFQRSELLGQFIRLLPQTQQKNPVKLQEVRRIVELFMILRNEVVAYGGTGEPRGMKLTSLQTLADLVQRPDVPLTRKVVQMRKLIFANHSLKHIAAVQQGREGTDPLAENLSEQIDFEYNQDFIEKSKALEELAEEGGEGLAGTEELPKFYLDLERHRMAVESPYTLAPGRKAVSEDEEVFRMAAPSADDLPVEALQDNPFSRPPLTKEIDHSIVRLLKARVGKFLTGDPYRVIETGEAPQYNSIIVFPHSILPFIGPIRSGSLALDVSLGMMKRKLFADILDELGEVSEVPAPDSMLHIGIGGNLAGNVYIKDWFQAQPMVLSGPGDIYTRLLGYGVKGIELNKEQTEIIAQKIQGGIAGLRAFLTKQRQENKAALQNLKFEPQPLLDEAAAGRLLARVKGEPVLQKAYEDVIRGLGELSKVDIQWFAYLSLRHPDYLLATLGQQPDIVTRERLRVVREQFLRRMNLIYLVEKLKKERVKPAKLNPCPHFESLEGIEKAAARKEDEPRDYTKQKLLLKFVNKFRKSIDKGWVWCNVCDQHLLCEHRFIQLQEFLRPAEKDVIHKKLLIEFSGGVFAGKYICKVCGQSIQDLDFDTNLEFDDEGRPMMGRSVMVDREAQEQEELEGVLSGPAEAPEETNFGSDVLNTMYKTLKRLAGLIGIAPDMEDYKKMVEEFAKYNRGLPTRVQYSKMKQQQDYDVYYSLRYVSAAAVILLLNIQTHMPDYIIYYTTADCKDGFMGWPLMEDEARLEGANCMASAIAAINDAEFPWNLTTLQKLANIQKRKDFIIKWVVGQAKSFMKQPQIQARLKRKREYQLNLYGSLEKGKSKETTPISFRPFPYVVKPEEAAAAPQVPEAAEPDIQASAWIQTAHQIAMANAPLKAESPFVSLTSCLHPITQPSAFWREQRLPPLEPRKLTKPFFRSVTTNIGFDTALARPLVGQIQPEDYYIVFSRLCYKGDNKGMPHKLGLTGTCSDCGLNILATGLFPPCLDLPSDLKEKEYEAQCREKTAQIAQQMRQHIVAQGVEISEGSFQELMSTARLKGSVPPEEQIPIPRAENTLTRLAAIDLAPLENWVPLLAGLQAALTEIGADLTPERLLTAAEDLVTAITQCETFLRQRLGSERFFNSLLELTKGSAAHCGDVLTSYFLVPYQRWLSGIQKESFKILDSYKLGDLTIKDIMDQGLGEHLSGLGSPEDLKGLPLRKVRWISKTLSTACREVFPKLRPILITGGQILQEYLLRAYVMGIFYKFLDPNFVPEDDTELEVGEAPNLKILYTSMTKCLRRFIIESHIPSEEEIRLKLEERAELEKQQMFREMEAMTPDRKRAELMNKKLGLGRFARGNQKFIREYNEDFYEIERAERAAAGFMDYPGAAFGRAAEGEGGYDHDQFGADDF